MNQGRYLRSEPLLAHHLPSAPKFAGRENELASLARYWSGTGGVLSIIGSGGAGKTALLAEFLHRVIAQDDFDAILVWSFYDDPSTDQFLKSCAEYFGGETKFNPSGAGWFHVLKDSLSDGRRNLIVLDGLERVQRTQTDSKGIYGELEDPLLQGLLRRLVAGAGNTHAIITSRFPVTDLESSIGNGYSVLNVDQLDREAAHRLLRNRGVKGTDSQVDSLISAFGEHALTLDLLGGAIAEFYDGDPTRLESPRLSQLEADLLQPMRLATVLKAYQENLSTQQVDLLSRLCIFRFGVSPDFLEDVFLKATSSNVAGSLAGTSREGLDADVGRLVELHLVHRHTGDGLTIHPAIRDHFYRIFRDTQSLHDAVSSHLMTLTARPGIGLPNERESLDLLEELVFHSIQAGRVHEAKSIYFGRMGGGDHLNVELGEYSRCQRILRAFDDCPDESAMYHCERAFGNFEEALKWRPQNVYILLLSGDLVRVAKEGSDTAKRAANFLMGHSLACPDRCPDYPLPAAKFQLLQRKYDDARRCAQRDISISLYRDDIVRNQFCLAEADLLSGHVDKAVETFNEASFWAISSGSAEHLISMHLVNARIGLIQKSAMVTTALEEALQIAVESKFRLSHVEVLNLWSQHLRMSGAREEALSMAQQAYKMASDELLQYAWGQLDALRQLVAGGQTEHLLELRDLQRRLDDPEISTTERMLAGG